MLQNIYYDNDNVIRIVSNTKIISNYLHHTVGDVDPNKSIIGTKICFNKPNKLKLAVICNWDDNCGISTYTKFLLESLKNKVDEIKIFSEINNNRHSKNDLDVEYCWKRGESLLSVSDKIARWNPSVVMLQHEFGIFPKASHFLNLMDRLTNIPTVVTLHSVYEHRDKSICTAAMKNIIVHSNSGKSCLINKLGHQNKNIYVVPHGCIEIEDAKPNWNYFGTPHSIVQFGFGFKYKGVNVVLEAINYLKNNDKRFKDIFYCYLCSSNPNTQNVQENYYNILKEQVRNLKLENNVTIQKGFFSEEELNNYLRTARLSVFPYVTDDKNVVYGASGAIRIAMANKTPVIASNSHMFDDLEGVVPRPSNYIELAKEIKSIFLNSKYREKIKAKQELYLKQNNWNNVSDKYIDVFNKVIDNHYKDNLCL